MDPQEPQQTDTKPRPPRKQDLPPDFSADLRQGTPYAPAPQGDYSDEDLGGPGCLMWALVLLVGGLIALMIVVMAGAAGWTDGKRVADRNVAATSAAFADRQLPAIETNVANLNDVQLATRVAFLATRTPGVAQVPALRQTQTAVGEAITATQAAAVDAQLTAIPQAVAAGDAAQVEQRLAFLTTQTPGVPQVPAFQATATQLAVAPPPTQATMLTPDAAATLAPDAATPSSTPADPAAGSLVNGFDLDALLAEAQDQFAFGQLNEAVETLDLIIRLDPDYQTAIVEDLMFDALTQQARPLYQVDLSDKPTDTETLAEAIRLTDQAELYGPVESLAYEREIASLYLNAIGAVQADNHAVAINRLNTIIAYQTSYKGANLNRLLFDEYVAYGDAFFQFDRDYCRAQAQYDAALALFNDAAVAADRDSARELCEQAQLATPVGTLLPGTTPVAPIGQPGG